jgi:pSer/pThr/pTyr-binding forkhead associated (FHA) protein
MWILATSDASTDGVAFRLPPDTVKTIGRSTGSEFIVEAPLVSRLHCQLTSTADSLHVRDLESTNGTFVNGNRVTSSPLREGDRLTVGRLEFTVSKSA